MEGLDDMGTAHSVTVVEAAAVEDGGGGGSGGGGGGGNCWLPPALPLNSPPALMLSAK